MKLSHLKILLYAFLSFFLIGRGKKIFKIHATLLLKMDYYSNFVEKESN